jgi:hypothetical protein
MGLVLPRTIQYAGGRQSTDEKKFAEVSGRRPVVRPRTTEAILNPIPRSNSRVGNAKVWTARVAGTLLTLFLLVDALLYAVPRTAVLGAILLTGYLGGATATHVRLGQPFFFPVVFGALLWGCLDLSDERLRALLSFDRRPGR